MSTQLIVSTQSIITTVAKAKTLKHSLRPGNSWVTYKRTKASPGFPAPTASSPPPPPPLPPKPSCLLVVYEADETGLQCTEAFWRSVPLPDAATVLQGAAPQGASLPGNWQGAEACSRHCLQRQRTHISAFPTPSLPSPLSTLSGQDLELLVNLRIEGRGSSLPAFTRAFCQTRRAAQE